MRLHVGISHVRPKGCLLFGHQFFGCHPLGSTGEAGPGPQQTQKTTHSQGLDNAFREIMVSVIPEFLESILCQLDCTHGSGTFTESFDNLDGQLFPSNPPKNLLNDTG